MDIVALGTWNATDAQAFKAENDTEFTAPQTSTSSTLLSTSNTPSASSTVVVTPTSSTTSDNTTSVASPKKSHVGAIVGGVVGGVGGAVIAAIALVLWLRHRKNQRRPPSAAFRNVAPLITTPYTPEPNEKRFSPSITTAPYSVASAGLIYVRSGSAVLFGLGRLMTALVTEPGRPDDLPGHASGQQRVQPEHARLGCVLCTERISTCRHTIYRCRRIVVYRRFVISWLHQACPGSLSSRLTCSFTNTLILCKRLVVLHVHATSINFHESLACLDMPV